MVILHCIPSMGGGGAERQLVYLAGGLKKLHHEVHVAYVREGVNGARLKESGAVIHKLNSINNHDPRLLLQLVSLIRAIKADIVQTWIPQMDMLGALAARMTGTVHILSERISGNVYSGGLKDAIRLAAGRRASSIVANSLDGARYWTGNGAAVDRVTTIRNALPFDEIDAVKKAERDRYHLTRTDRVVLFAGRYAEQKNVRNLVDGFARVLAGVDDCVVLMFGCGPEKNAILEKVGDLDLAGRLKVMDYTDELWSVMKIADAFVSVSHSEGVPNTVIEAVVCGCPVVLSRIPPHLELFDAGCACYADKDDPGDIAEKVIGTLMDPDGSRTRASAAYDVVRDWTIMKVAGEYARLYEKVLHHTIR